MSLHNGKWRNLNVSASLLRLYTAVHSQVIQMGFNLFQKVLAAASFRRQGQSWAPVETHHVGSHICTFTCIDHNALISMKLQSLLRPFFLWHPHVRSFSW